MGKGDRCAVFMCNNDRRFKEKLTIQDHVKEMKWHYCPPKYRPLWQRLLRRKDFVITDNTRICSNHFVLGRPLGQHPHPCLYMKGYEGQESHRDNAEIQDILASWSEHRDDEYMRTRCGTIKRKLDMDMQTSKKSCSLPTDDHCYSVGTPSSSTVEAGQTEVEHESPYKTSTYSLLDMQEEHLYACGSTEQEITAKCTCVKCDVCKKQWSEMEDERDALQNEVERFKVSLEEQTSEASAILEKKYTIDSIKHSDKLILLHTGLSSYNLFSWVFNTVKPCLPQLQYYKANQAGTKSYQLHKNRKPGPKRLLSQENELLVTLMKLKLNLTEQFLGHLFGTSKTLMSTILSTWLPLLSYELVSLIHWPTTEELKLYYPDCFKKYKQVAAIIDCTEVPVQRPSLAKANSQIFSSYKGRPTIKLLVACTPAGTISFVSKSAGGNMSDKDIVKRSGILEKFVPGDTVLADRGFNIQELLLDRSVKLEIPPFLRGKKQFSEADDQRTKQVANARIHVERVIGRMKDFNIMKAELPLDMIDLFDHISVVVAALVNLQPPIVPLHCN